MRAAAVLSMLCWGSVVKTRLVISRIYLLQLGVAWRGTAKLCSKGKACLKTHGSLSKQGDAAVKLNVINGAWYL